MDVTSSLGPVYPATAELHPEAQLVVIGITELCLYVYYELILRDLKVRAQHDRSSGKIKQQHQNIFVNKQTTSYKRLISIIHILAYFYYYS